MWQLRRAHEAFVLILIWGCGPPAPAASTAPAPAPPPVSATPPTAGAPAALPSLSTTSVPPISPAVTVRVGVLGLAGDAGIFIGQERGYFQDEGIDVHVTILGAGPDAIPPLAAGQLDVGGPTPDASLLNAVSRDVPIKIVADKGRYLSDRPASGALVVRKDLVDAGTITQVADLKGRPVGTVAAQSSNAIDIHRLMEPVGLSERDVELVSMPFPDMIPALANRTLDAAFPVEPFVAFAVGQGVGVRWKGAEAIYPDHQIAVLLYGPQFWQTQPEAARRFMVGYLRGVRDYNDAFFKNQGRAEVVGILTKYTAIKDPAVYDRMGLVGLNPNGRVEMASIVYDQDWFVSRGALSRAQDLSALIDQQYVDYALQRLGEYH
jgi:ABC-type nitrate/sulfonate/bicarbonate transport system substrate-binding protein